MPDLKLNIMYSEEQNAVDPRGKATLLSHKDAAPKEGPVHFRGKAALYCQKRHVGFPHVPHFSHAIISDRHQQVTAQEQ